MDKDVKEFLEFLTDKDTDCNLWELETYLNDPKERKTLLKIFSPDLLTFLQGFLKHLIYATDKWHNEEDESSHEDIRAQIRKLQAQFRNHRHDYSKAYTGKAEY